VTDNEAGPKILVLSDEEITALLERMRSWGTPADYDVVAARLKLYGELLRDIRECDDIDELRRNWADIDIGRPE
jgi:hypothetical protein